MRWEQTKQREISQEYTLKLLSTSAETAADDNSPSSSCITALTTTSSTGELHRTGRLVTTSPP